MRNMRIYTVLVGLTLLLAACTSYEDAFNRNLDSTGLYITNSSSNTVSQFAADPKSGILNDLGTVAAGTTPVYVAVNAAGTFAYVVNSGSNDVYVYSINTKTRKLAFASSVATGTLPRMIGLHSGGKFAYVVNETSNGQYIWVLGRCDDRRSDRYSDIFRGRADGCLSFAINDDRYRIQQLFDYRGCRLSGPQPLYDQYHNWRTCRWRNRHYLRMQRCPNACGKIRHNAADLRRLFKWSGRRNWRKQLAWDKCRIRCRGGHKPSGDNNEPRRKLHLCFKRWLEQYLDLFCKYCDLNAQQVLYPPARRPARC
jgi:YVTN family beta-propeller protein